MSGKEQYSVNEAVLNQYEQEMAMANAQQAQGMPYSPAMFGNSSKQNLIEWELDFKPELESVERLLRCDMLHRDKEGNEYWIPNPDPSKIFMNEQGVSDLIRNIIIIVNKNKALSNYNAEEINARVCQMKHEIRMIIVETIMIAFLIIYQITKKSKKK